MRIWNEDDFEWRHGDHGPKYICETDAFKFGLVYLGSGHHISRHVHRIIHEIFYVLYGKADFYVCGIKYTVEAGQVIHIEPNDVHAINNPYDQPVKMTLAATKTAMPDKVTLDDTHGELSVPKSLPSSSAR